MDSWGRFEIDGTVIAVAIEAIDPHPRVRLRAGADSESSQQHQHALGHDLSVPGGQPSAKCCVVVCQRPDGVRVNCSVTDVTVLRKHGRCFYRPGRLTDATADTDWELRVTIWKVTDLVHPSYSVNHFVRGVLS